MNRRIKVDMHVNVIRLLDHNKLDLSIVSGKGKEKGRRQSLRHKLMMQMMSLKRGVTETGMKIETEKGKHDDWPAALALALKGLSAEGKVQLLQDSTGKPIDVGGRARMIANRFRKPQRFDLSKIRY